MLTLVKKNLKLKNIVKDAIILVLLLTCIGEGVVIGTGAFGASDGIASTRKLQQIKGAIDKYYLEDVDDEKLEEYTYKGLVAGLNDPYSTYYTKEEYEEVSESNSGVFSGIGAVIQQDADTGECKVVRTISDSPAQKAGVKAGDVIYKIDGKEVSASDDLSNVVSKVKGKEGTKVKITFLRDQKEKTFTITRKKIETPTVESEMLDNKVGYIQITQFEEVTVQQFQDALNHLEQNGMKKLVIDLRDNPGGLLTSVVQISDMILPKGTIVYTKDKNGKKEEYNATTDEKVDVPIAVLVNGNSASASEILAGAIQDYGAGTLVGTTTFGKGIVQNIMKMSDGSALKLTISKYYTPKGRNIHKKGIKPDVEVKLKESLQNKSEISKEEDNQLQKAISVLKDK